MNFFNHFVMIPLLIFCVSNAMPGLSVPMATVFKFIPEVVQEFHDVIVTNETQEFEAQEKELNYRPIIGILSQGLSRGMRRSYSHTNFSSYIAASYVKFVESAGARVVPVLINRPRKYYEELATYLNGFLFPGGGAPFTSHYAKTANLIYNIVKRNMTEGKQLPLWATCLGFEYLLYFEAGKNPLTRCSASNMADPLFFQPGFNDSQLFGSMSETIVESLATKNITANFHKWCVLPETFYGLDLNSSMRMLSTSYDKNGVEYASTVEHKYLPIFGTQWHPEKAAFEWADRRKHNSIPHTLEAIQASQALAETFVQKARENINKFPSRKEEEDQLIYNYSPTFVAKAYNSSFQLCYFF